MLKVKPSIDYLKDKVFSSVHTNNLVYNTCWEDPRCDRELLTIAPDSKLVMITSAGCNALDYLLDNPQVIHTIDVNPRQNALLELKIAAFKYLPYQEIWQLFGLGYHPQAVQVYAQHLRPNLPSYAQEFWDRNIIHFTKKSFYFFGTSGNFAWLFNQYINLKPELRDLINQLLAAQSLKQQVEIYQIIEPKIVNPLSKWFISRHLTLTMLGVPRAQRRLIVDEYPGGVSAYVADSLRQIFTEIPIRDNYFWRLYLTGQYTPTCCPAYLSEENFELLRERVDRLELHTQTLSQFLTENPDHYSHYILLDHQDWLAAHDIPALHQEWKLILNNSKPGSKTLLRSAALRVNFFPEFVTQALEFEQTLTQKLHNQDRVGTYGSVYLGIVQ